MSPRLPDDYFDAMYEAAADPWQLAARWYERRKYAITLAVLPDERYGYAFEPGCSVGVLTEALARRCDRVTATDVADGALTATRRRLADAGTLDRVDLQKASIDGGWPDDVDLVVLSELLYYLDAAALRGVLEREVPRLRAGTTVLTAHWRHPVEDYPLTGDAVTRIVADTPALHRLAGYLDDDVVVAVYTVGEARSVAARTGVPGAR